MKFDRSKELQPRIHRLIPGGCHTYAKGDDQYPELSPGVIARGDGAHVWDVDGNEFIEYGLGGRSVGLGHNFEPVVAAAREAMGLGASFTRPHELELRCAEAVLRAVPYAEMVKFTKDGSTATSGAVKLARAVTGRDMVALCHDQPFFSYDDWFIGTTPMDAGIPQAIKDMTVTFPYDDLDALRRRFEENTGRIACVIMEPVKYDDPQPGYLQAVKDLCHEHGALFILDEMICGFRLANAGGQEFFDVEPDLSTFGKAMANGFACSALCGKRAYMELGGIHHDKERVFLLSTTHGAETHALAATIACIRFYLENPVIEALERKGMRLAAGIQRVVAGHGLSDYVQVHGKPCNLVFGALDPQGKPSQAYRSLLIQELIRRGVLGPSLVVAYAHTDEDIDRTIDAFDGAMPIYQRALEDGAERHLVGAPSNIVYRRYN
ncbi:MAG: glutamate-1-semialdehyde 2,1-aminomutase [Planctomycetota bacterium]